MVRAPGGVFTVCTISNFPGEVSFATARVPSRQLARAVGGEELWLAAEVDLRVGRPGLGIDVGRDGDEAAGVAADDQDLLAGRIVNDAVGVLLGLDLAEDFVRVGVEDGDVGGVAVG